MTDLGVSCPWCGEPAGRPCTTADGGVAHGTHVTRSIDAGRWHALPTDRLIGGMWDDSERMTRRRRNAAVADTKMRAA